MGRSVIVIGGGVVGAASALALARRGAEVLLLEAEPALALGASGTNSGILHSGFDSPPGELETQLILRSAALRDEVIAALGIPIARTGAVLRARSDDELEAIGALEANARINGVAADLDGHELLVPGEHVTDPVAYTLALASAAQAHGATLRTGARVTSARAVAGGGVTVALASGETVGADAVVNAAGLHADEVAAGAGDHGAFAVYPRKGEFFVFDPPGGEPLDRILLPIPDRRTKGVLVFPTLEGRIVAGPTAVDQADKRDWSVRPEARAEVTEKAAELLPGLAEAQPVAHYAGLRPAGEGVNYVIESSGRIPEMLHVAAIRSTGLSASLGIADLVAERLAARGLRLAEPAPLRAGDPPALDEPWWRRAAAHWAA